MLKQKLLAIITSIIFGFAIIISIPIVILSTGFSPYSTIKHYEDYYYTSLNSSTLNEINVIVDVGDIEIAYTYAPVDYHIKVEVNIEMRGQNIPGKSYLDYFKAPEWKNSSNSVTFSLELLSESWFDPSLWTARNISIIVTLNANILFDINTTTNLEGDVEIYVSGGVNINDVNVNVNTPNSDTRSNVFILFDYCIIEGDLTGIANQADVEVKSTNVQYIQNSILSLSSNNGSLKFDILQYEEMGANITMIGYSKTDYAIIEVIYKDYSSNIGAVLILNNWDGTTLPINTQVGFNRSSIYGPQKGYIFTSYDFPNKNNYNITLNRKETGNIWPYFWNLYSEPIEED